MTHHITWSRHNLDGTPPNITHGQATFRFQRRSCDQFKFVIDWIVF